MAVGLDQDTESLQRGSIPSGGAGTLSDGGFKNCFAGVWVYRPSATTTYALTAAGSFIHFQAGAREVVLGFNSAGSVLSDLNLQIIFNSGGGAGTPATFSGHTGASFLDEWVYYFIADNPTDGQIAGYIRLADLATAVTQVRANDNAGSQFVNTLTFGNNSSNNAVALGNYAFARAAYNTSTGYNTADALAFAATSSTSGDWGFWPLADNTDTGDDSGNARTITFNGTLSSESDPSLSGPPPSISVQPANQRVPAGNTATVSVTASGGTLTYQWQTNASGSWVDISGETASSYTTGTLTAGTSYAVRVNVTDANGTTTSASAAIWTPTAKPPAWAGYFSRGGMRDMVRANARVPIDDAVGLAYSNALFGAAPAGANFTYTSSGGITFGGTASTDSTRNYLATSTGGLSFAGAATALQSRNFEFTSSGGIQLGGDATETFTRDFSATSSGGVQFGGTAAATAGVEFTFSGSGGLTFGGVGTTAYSPDYVFTSSGGIVLGGTASAVESNDYVASSSGGVQFGGTAAAQFDAGFVVTGSGGLQFAGAATATPAYDYTHSAAGGVQFGGAATTESSGSGAAGGDMTRPFMTRRRGR